MINEDTVEPITMTSLGGGTVSTSPVWNSISHGLHHTVPGPSFQQRMEGNKHHDVLRENYTGW